MKPFNSVKIKKQFFPSAFFGFLFFSLILISMSGCQKQTIFKSQPVTQQTSDDATTLMEKVNGRYVFTLRPGKTDGQDTYVAKIDSDPNDGNGNLNWTNELVIAKWTSATGPVATWRSFIKFDSLIKLPAATTIISAKLHLYGVSSSISAPQGNSYYEGSSNPTNKSLVQRVISNNWDEATLTWNNQPSTTEDGQAIIKPSSSQWNYDATMDVTNIVQQMVSNPSSNYGFCIKLAEEHVYRSLIFATSENSDKSKRPKLVITF